MLVLTRKKDQALVIADNIVITVLDIQGDQIRLGVEAPKSVKIFRKELYLEILEENKNAAKPAAQVLVEDLKNILSLPESGSAKNLSSTGAFDSTNSTDSADSTDSTKDAESRNRD